MYVVPVVAVSWGDGGGVSWRCFRGESDASMLIVGRRREHICASSMLASIIVERRDHGGKMLFIRSRSLRGVRNIDAES